MALFTAANAREMAARSQASRHANTIAAKEAKTAQPLPSQPESALAVTVPPSDGFASKRLTRVRKQLDKLDRMIDEETDPQRLDRLASAQARLAEQERQLADRPLPGTKRPTSDKPSRRSFLDPTPEYSTQGQVEQE